MVIEKKCSRCYRDLPTTHYVKDRKNPDGLSRWCRTCCATYMQERSARLEANKPPATKQCRGCKETLAATEFYGMRNATDTLASYCKKCTVAKNREWRNANREHVRVRSRAYYADNAEKIREYDKRRRPNRVEQIQRNNKRWREDNPDRKRQLNRESVMRRRWVLKLEVIEAYGGFCDCCGENDPQFLCLDHVNCDGGKQRRALGIGSADETWRWAKKTGWPSDLRLLCYNCNMTSWRTDGTCMHQVEAHDLFWGNLKAA